MYTFHYDSRLGGITLASDGEALTGLWFDGQKYFGDTLGDDRPQNGKPAMFREAVEWLDEYFGGKVPNFTPKLRFMGSEFRCSIWEALLTIPYGQTRTYGELAKMTGSSARAVGGAVAHNPISIIVPCHRVVGADGSLRGYSGGLERKRELLLLEGVSCPR